MSATMLNPSQYALKLPATSPERMFSDAPPSREDVTTSLTWADSTEVKILTSSGMMAPASVPQVMIVDSFHQSVPSPRSAIRTLDTAQVATTDRSEVSRTSCGSGDSRCVLVAVAYRAFAIASLRR